LGERFTRPPAAQVQGEAFARTGAGNAQLLVALGLALLGAGIVVLATSNLGRRREEQ
jgi:hypothetical protein